jgi:hypothetical protein
MTDKEILGVLEQFEHDYALPKSGERERELIFLCLYINRQPEKGQRQFKDFFIRELKTNQYGNQLWASAVLAKLNDQTLILDIYSIFYHFYQQENFINDSFDRSKMVFLLLMKLKDLDINHSIVYSDYVNRVLVNKISNSHNFVLIINYILVNTIHAIEILSNYYAKSLFTTSEELVWHKRCDIFFPCEFFIANSFEYMCRLIQSTYKKNKQSGLLLKRLFMDYALHSHSQNKQDWNKRQEMNRYLNTITFDQ